MITQKDNPVEWSLLIGQLDDLEEHCKYLSALMVKKGSIEIEDFQIQISHLYAHLNRIWNSRNHVGEVTDLDFQKHSKFPSDIEPKG